MADAQEEATVPVYQLIQQAVNSSMKAVADKLGQIVETKFEELRFQNVEEVHSAVKKSKEPLVQFNKLGNKQQFRHQEAVQEKIDDAKEALRVGKLDSVKKSLEEGTSLINKRMKLIRIADKSQFGWSTVLEYQSDELASDSDDEKKIFRSERRAEKRMKDAKRKRIRSRPYSRPSNPKGKDEQRNVDYVPPSSARRIGPCFKISIFYFIHYFTTHCLLVGGVLGLMSILICGF